MDRNEQAVAMLRDNKSKGLSYFDSRQMLLQQGFSDSEIDDASDKLDRQSATEQTSHDTTDSTSPIQTPELLENIPHSTSNIFAWYAAWRIKIFILIASFVVVFAAGNLYVKHHSNTHLMLYFGANILSALTAIYLNLILNIRGHFKASQPVVAWVFGIVSCIGCFFFLWFVSLSVLR